MRLTHDGPSLFSQELHAEANWRWMGCGLLLPRGTQVVNQGLVDTLPKRQRGLWAVVELPGRSATTVVSWHGPNASGDGRDVKTAAFSAMSTWLAGAQHPVVLGADLNTWLTRLT